MNNLPRILIAFALVSMALGVLVKLFGADLTGYLIAGTYPVRPISFLNFANTLLLLSIAVSLLNRGED